MVGAQAEGVKVMAESGCACFCSDLQSPEFAVQVGVGLRRNVKAGMKRGNEKKRREEKNKSKGS